LAAYNRKHDLRGQAFHCVVGPGPNRAIYGCSTTLTLAKAALERAHKRGAKSLELQERDTRPRGVVGWLPPTHEK